jgi:hypothetical protein
MSKISITPNASGTGVFTISSPATNTDRTLTLPDEAGTVLTSASSVVAAKLTGALPAISGAALTSLPLLGVGQSWTDVTASRLIGTTYTNSTGSPIEVAVSCRNTSANAGWGIFLTIDGATTIGTTGVAGGVSDGYWKTASAIVPNGSTYSVTLSDANYISWRELR